MFRSLTDVTPQVLNLDSRALLRMTARERRKQRKDWDRERTGSLKLFVTLSYVRLARARRSFLELHVSSSDAHLISFLD